MNTVFTVVHTRIICTFCVVLVASSFETLLSKIRIAVYVHCPGWRERAIKRLFMCAYHRKKKKRVRRGENRRKKKWKRLLWIKIREHISKVVVPYAVPQNTVLCKVPICVALYYMGMCSVHLCGKSRHTHFYYAICMVQVRREYIRVVDPFHCPKTF